MTVILKPRDIMTDIADIERRVRIMERTGRVTPAVVQAGWSVNVYKMRVHLNANQAVAAGVSTKIAFDTVDWDTANAWDATNFWWVVPLDGYYDIKAKVNVNTGAQAWSWFQLTLFIELTRGVSLIYDSQTNIDYGTGGAPTVLNNAGMDAVGADTFRALKGDLVSVQANANNSAGAAMNLSGGGHTGSYTYLSMQLIST